MVTVNKDMPLCKRGDDFKKCRSEGMVSEGPTTSMELLITDHSKLLQTFEPQFGPNVARASKEVRMRHTVKNIMFQLLLAEMHLQRKDMVARTLGWNYVRYAKNEIPPRLFFGDDIVQRVVRRKRNKCRREETAKRLGNEKRRRDERERERPREAVKKANRVRVRGGERGESAGKRRERLYLRASNCVFTL